MRTLNVRLAVILLVILVVGGAGAYFIHKVQQKSNAVFFLEQAEIAKQNLEKAKKENNSEEQAKALKKQIENLRWYLSFRPKDMDVMESLGLLMADNISNNINDDRSFAMAYGYLDIVVREDPNRDKVRRRLIDLMMLSGSRYRCPGTLDLFAQRSRRTIRSCCNFWEIARNIRGKTRKPRRPMKKP